MSYIDHKEQFSSNITELNPAEIDLTAGGIPLLIGIAYVGIGLSTGTLIVGGGFLVGLRLSQH